LPTIRRFATASALIAFGTLLALSTMEGALRVYDAFKGGPRPRAQLWEPRPGYGWLHPAGGEGVYADDNGEYSVVVKMNSHGLRDVEHEYEKSPGVFRILLLGDSYMEGVQVRLESIFPRLLEAALNDGRHKVEIINASAAEWGTDNELVYFREEGIRYSPDLVLLAFTTANDLRNNSVDLNLRVPIPNPYKPTFTMAPDGGLQFHPIPPRPASPPPPPWWQSVRVAVFFANRLGLNPPASLPPPPDIPASRRAQISKVPTDMLVYASPPVPQIAEAWLVTEALILQMKAEAEQHGAGFAMFLVNGPWVHYDDYWRLMTMYDHVARDTWNRRTPNDTLAPFVKEHGIACLDLFDEFDAKKTVEPLYFKFDPHWTPAGHRLAAQTVARFLIENAIVPPSQTGGH
jgi:hypothetical protein